MVHGHVTIFLNFVTFPLIVLIKIVQVIKNIFFGTEFVINNKPPLKKENSYAWLDYVVPEIFPGEHFGWWRNTFRSHSCLIDVCFLLFYKRLPEECFLNEVIFPVAVITTLHYIYHGFSFRIKELWPSQLYSYYVIKTVLPCDATNTFRGIWLNFSNRLSCLYKHG